MRDLDHGPGDQVGSGDEDDFELGDGTGAAEYAVSDEEESDAAAAAVAEPSAEAAPSAEAPPAAGEAGGQATGEATTGEKNGPPVPEVPHSVQTGGDVLLD